MGSLFKARDLWSTRVAANEEFDFGLCTTLQTAEGTRLVVGSHQGVLRIFNAKKKGYRAEDLLCEQVVGMPILQVGVGNFGNREQSLVVLTPRRVLIGGINQQQGEKTDGDPMSKIMALAFDHEYVLEHTAYNMVVGQFGGSKAASQVCVQSMDGQLAFFAGSGLQFARYLPSTTFLCPGRLLYVPAIDGFLTGTSTFELQCYKYATLAQGTASETKEGEALGRKVSPDWSLNLGEDIVDFCYARVTKGLSNQQVDIIVLGEHTLYFVKQENGELRSNKRLDVHPSCIAPYLLPDKKSHNILIGTYDNQIQVFNDKALVWSAKTSTVPLYLTVATVCKTEGMIVMLGQDGTLSANYLGTDPASDPVQLLESKEFDYEQMDEEQRRLQQVIRQALNGAKTEPKDVVVIDCDQPTIEGQGLAQVICYFSYTGQNDLENVVVTVHAHQPIEVVQTTQVIQFLPKGERIPVPFQFRLTKDAEKMTPTSLVADFFACFNGPNGEALSSKANVFLPLALVGIAVPPMKNNAFVIQIDTDQPAPPLTQLFADLRAHEIENNLLSFQYSNGADATILASKNGGRYRVQGGTFEALWILSSELTRRLKAFYRQNSTTINITIPEAVPLGAYFLVIDQHFAGRQKLDALQEELGELAHQFRAIQKRLLVRFRDKNPAPLNSLETLFQHTHRRLHMAAERVDEAERELAVLANGLSCATHLIIFLTRYRYQHLDQDDMEMFKHFLSPTVNRSAAIGWEETTDASMTHLLRTTLSKSSKEAASAPAAIVKPEDTTKLKKHLTIVFDRIGKGGNVREQTKKDNITIAEGKKPRNRPAE